MILNGKCADRFKEWLESSNHTPWVVFFESLPPLVQCAYYVEWFDLHGINTEVEYLEHLQQFKAKAKDLKSKVRIDINELFTSRTEALKAAIEKGNDFYNTKNQ